MDEFTAWGEFRKSWGWGVKDGSPALQACGPEVGVATCQVGIPGSGAGQLFIPNGIAVAPGGASFILERENHRVQKFSPSGQFLLMFGGEVNDTTGGNLCTAASGEICKVGKQGSGNGEFSDQPQLTPSYVTVGTDGTVYVGDENRIQEFNQGGEYVGEIPLPLPGFASNLAFDPTTGDVLFTYFTSVSSSDPLIYRLDPETGGLVGSPISLGAPTQGRIEAVSVDGDGDVIAIFEPPGVGFAETEPRVIEVAPDGKVLIDFDEEFAAPPTAKPAQEPTVLSSVGVNKLGDVYVLETAGASFAAVSAYGPPPVEYGPPPPNPPTISDQYASTVGHQSATVKAKINPRFWADTAYYLEYGAEPCFEGGCAKVPAPPGSTLTDQVVNVGITSEGTNLFGLFPGTTYHYRFVAQSSGGGPTIGLAGKSGAEAEGTFTTLPVAAPQPPCPANDPFRAGPGAKLPDCRAYEMVSPVDKNGADIETVFNSNGFRAQLNQAATDGEALTYSAYRAFGEVESSPYSSQYIASRGAAGWSSRGISPPREGPSLYTTGQLDFQYKGFTSDLCHGWLLQDTDHPLAEGWVEGSPTVYQRELCPANG
ncbi:MAG TPA: hypothetical protein VFI17_04785, partial [Solirubrobacterales bacterium]|nr:hypothetical protein [Solirubrobacterales bacterium]